MLLTTAPAGGAATRLVAILTVGARLAITGVLLGAWPPGATWQVNPDGTTHPHQRPDTTGPRLNMLTSTATADILDTLAQAHPTREDTPPNPAPATPAPPTWVPAPPTARPDTPPAAAQPGTRQRAPAPPTDTPAPHAPTLRLRVLGRPVVRIADADTTTDLHLRRSDSLPILVHLAVHPDGATSDQLMAAIWPETRPHHARGRFHTTISELRKTLTEALGADPITRTHGRYHLDPTRVDVDLWHLTAAAHQATTTLDPTEHQQILHNIVGLYTGPLAEGHNWLWLAPHRETTRRHVLDAYIGLADTQPDPHAALTHIQDAIRVDPYNEHLYQRAMHLHATLNSPDGLTRTLHALTQRLAELEIPLSPATQQTAHDLLAKLQARQRATPPP